MPHRKAILILFVIHTAILVLASTRFTLITATFDRNHNVAWDYLQYRSQSGFGRLYDFPIPLHIVLAYIAAYATGIALAWYARRAWGSLRFAALATSAIGLLSYLYELTHWFHSSYSAWVLSIPALALLLATVIVLQSMKQPVAPPQSSAQPA